MAIGDRPNLFPKPRDLRGGVRHLGGGFALLLQRSLRGIQLAPLRFRAGRNLQVRQGRLQLLHAGLGDLCLPEIEMLEVAQALEVLDPGVRHRCAVEIQVGQVG